MGQRPVAGLWLPPPPEVRQLAAADLPERVSVVGERGRGGRLLPPPPARRPAAAVLVHFPPPPPLAVGHPAAAALRDRDLVVGRRPVADFWLPPPPAAWRPAAAVLVHFPLPPPPAVRQPAAAAWQDRHHLGGGREVQDLLPPPPPPVMRPALAAAWGVWGTALVRWQQGAVGMWAPPVAVEPAAAADLVISVMVPSVAMATTLGTKSWARMPPPFPVIASVAWLPAGTFGLDLGAWAETRSEEERTELRHDLAEDVCADRATLLEPYL